MPRKIDPTRAQAQSAYLRGQLEKAGITQQQLAERLGVNQSFVSRLVRGERRLSPELVEAVARVFGVTTSEAQAGLDPHRAPYEAVHDKARSAPRQATEDGPTDPSLEEFLKAYRVILGITEDEIWALRNVRFKEAPWLKKDINFWRAYLSFWRGFTTARELEYLRLRKEELLAQLEKNKGDIALQEQALARKLQAEKLAEPAEDAEKDK